MEKYLMMMYVTLEQESAVKQLFLSRGWNYIKQDLTKMTSDVGPVTMVSHKKGPGPQYIKQNDPSFLPSPLPKKKGRPPSFKTSVYSDVDGSYQSHRFGQSTPAPTYPFAVTTNANTKLKPLAPIPTASLSPLGGTTEQEQPFVKLTNICKSKQFDLSKSHVYIGGTSLPASHYGNTTNSTVGMPKTSQAKPANKKLMVNLAGMCKSKELGLSKTKSVPQFKKQGKRGRPKQIPTQASIGQVVSLAPPDMPMTATDTMATLMASPRVLSPYTPPKRGRPPKKSPAFTQRTVKVEPVSPPRGQPQMSKSDIGLAVGMRPQPASSSTTSSPQVMCVSVPSVKKGRPPKNTPVPKGPPKKRGRPPKTPEPGPPIPKIDGRTKAAKLAKKAMGPSISVPKIDGRSKASKLAEKTAGPAIPKVDGRTKLSKWAKKAAMLKAMSSSGNTSSSSWTTVMSPSGSGVHSSTGSSKAAGSSSSPAIQITSVTTLSGLVPSSSSSLASGANQLPWRTSSEPVVVKREPIDIDMGETRVQRVDSPAPEQVENMGVGSKDATVSVSEPTSTPRVVAEGTSYIVTQNIDMEEGETPVVVNGVCHESVAEVDSEDIVGVVSSTDIVDEGGASCNQMSVSVDAMFEAAEPVIK